MSWWRVLYLSDENNTRAIGRGNSWNVLFPLRWLRMSSTRKRLVPRGFTSAYGGEKIYFGVPLGIPRCCGTETRTFQAKRRPWISAVQDPEPGRSCADGSCQSWRCSHISKEFSSWWQNGRVSPGHIMTTWIEFFTTRLIWMPTTWSQLSDGNSWAWWVFSSSEQCSCW